MPSQPSTRCAHAGPKLAATSILAPAIRASEVSAKYDWPVIEMKP